MAGFMLGAAGMFAVTYSTQAILPEIGRTFDVSPAEAGLTVSVVVLALAAGAWIWGPLSDRYGRKHSIVLASAKEFGGMMHSSATMSTNDRGSNAFGSTTVL